MFSTARGLLGHALPVLIAQLSSIGMMLVDTAVLGHVGARDLAAVAIGGGIHVAVVFALVGILQAVTPLAANLLGAGRHTEMSGVLQQGFWLACLLSLPGMLFLMHPDLLLGAVPMSPEVAADARGYLGLLAWGLPASLCYRTFYGFCNALGRPRVLMVIGLAGLLVHAFLAWGFAVQGWLGAPQGAAGCAVSNIVVAWFEMLSGALYLALGEPGRRYRLFAAWRRPSWPVWREYLRLGVPMGVSNFIEITSFTLIALFIAPLGEVVVAGHRIAASLAAFSYMLPLSLAIATLAGVGRALGGAERQRARQTMRAGLMLAAVSSTLAGLLIWLLAQPVAALYSDDPEVRAMAAHLMAYIAVYQFFDALQTVAGHVLRAYRVTLLPMLVQAFCFWGIGLAGGGWLCYRMSPGLGVDGFWIASVLSLVAASILLGVLLWQCIRASEQIP